jgi:molecular chaperone DnaK (HSP70)
MTLKTLAHADEEGKSRRILIAIDFGTTYSGIAWAQTARVCIPSFCKNLTDCPLARCAELHRAMA